MLSHNEDDDKQIQIEQPSSSSIGEGPSVNNTRLNDCEIIYENIKVHEVLPLKCRRINDVNNTYDKNLQEESKILENNCIKDLHEISRESEHPHNSFKMLEKAKNEQPSKCLRESNILIVNPPKNHPETEITVGKQEHDVLQEKKIENKKHGDLKENCKVNKKHLKSLEHDKKKSVINFRIDDASKQPEKNKSGGLRNGKKNISRKRNRQDMDVKDRPCTSVTQQTECNPQNFNLQTATINHFLFGTVRKQNNVLEEKKSENDKHGNLKENCKVNKKHLKSLENDKEKSVIKSRINDGSKQPEKNKSGGPRNGKENISRKRNRQDMDVKDRPCTAVTRQTECNPQNFNLQTATINHFLFGTVRKQKHNVLEEKKSENDKHGDLKENFKVNKNHLKSLEQDKIKSVIVSRINDGSKQPEKNKSGGPRNGKENISRNRKRQDMDVKDRPCTSVTWQTECNQQNFNLQTETINHFLFGKIGKQEHDVPQVNSKQPKKNKSGKPRKVEENISRKRNRQDMDEKDGPCTSVTQQSECNPQNCNFQLTTFECKKGEEKDQVTEKRAPKRIRKESEVNDKRHHKPHQENGEENKNLFENLQENTSESEKQSSESEEGENKLSSECFRENNDRNLKQILNLLENTSKILKEKYSFKNGFLNFYLENERKDRMKNKDPQHCLQENDSENPKLSRGKEENEKEPKVTLELFRRKSRRQNLRNNLEGRGMMVSSLQIIGDQQNFVSRWLWWVWKFSRELLEHFYISIRII